MKIIFRKRFEKSLKKLPQQVRERLYERLRVFKNNPFERILNNHSVDKAFPNCRSINITGDYRAIYLEEGNMMTFIDIGTHSELY